jgi:hypothetical protein
MKTGNLGQFLLWRKKPAKIIGETSRRQVIIEMLENKCCPHCNGDLGKDQIHVTVSSPMYQEGAERLDTILDDTSIIVSD